MGTQLWKFALLLLEFVAVHGQSQTPETCEGETCEEGVFMQVRSMPASFLELSLAQIRSGARGAPVEQLKQQLRSMAMARVGAGSGDPNYTVWNISQANFSAVFASIKEDMEAIIDEIELSATRDNNQLELARGAVADCNTQLNRSVPQDVQDLGALHRACRVQEALDLAARDQAFQNLTVHLQNPTSQSVQTCLQDFGRGQCEVSVDITRVKHVQQARECSEEIRNWAVTYQTQLDTLQSTYDSAFAAHAAKAKECNVYQQEFEIGYCTLRTHLEDQCSEQHACYDSALSLFSSTSRLILQSNASRYVAYTSARQVQCYIDVLSTDNLTASAVDSCDQAQFDTSNLTLNIPELPAMTQCVVSHDDFPCMQAWINANYGDFPSGVHLAACRPCAVATTPPTSSVASVRLVDGDTPRSGRLEIFHRGQWGSVCVDLFDDNAAEVACHQLGYLGGTTLGGVGGGSGPVWMDQVACTGSESYLWECNFTGWGYHNCLHQRDVGVRCQAGWVQLNTSMSPPSARDSASLVVANGAEAYLFGGRGDGPIRLGDFWKLTIQADDQARWTQITPMIGTPPSPRQNHVSVWTGSIRNSILIFSGQSDTESMNDLYEFTLDTSAWSQLIPNRAAGSPARRLRATAIWAPGRGMLMYGGLADYDSHTTDASDLWEFSFSQAQNGSWSLLDASVPSGLGSDHGHVAVWASNLGSGGKMLIYGDYFGFGSIWAYDPNLGSGHWVLDPHNREVLAVFDASAAWSPTGRSMRFFGGGTSESAGEHNFLQEWSSDDGWVYGMDLYPTPPPRSRRLHNAVWMARDDGAEAMVIFGGVEGSTRYQDAWRLPA